MTIIQFPLLICVCSAIVSGFVNDDIKHLQHFGSSYNVNREFLRTVIMSVQGILQFFSEEIENVNLDAIIGTRIADDVQLVFSSKGVVTNLISSGYDPIEFGSKRTRNKQIYIGSKTRRLLEFLGVLLGIPACIDQMQLLLGKYTDSVVALVEPDIFSDIHVLQQAAEYISNTAIPFVQKQSPRYFHRIGANLRNGFWRIESESKDIDMTRAVTPAMSGEAMHEKDSDDCLTELFGTTGLSQNPCEISDTCWRRMTSPGYRGYSLSHQIFYLEIGVQAGCRPAMDVKIRKHYQPSLETLAEGFCAAMLREAETIARARFPLRRRDLFMEEATLCGMIGYRQFFRYHWLENILSWQRRSGCFGDDAIDSKFIAPKGKSMDEEFKRTVSKREERVLSDRCLAHKTTVALGALTQYMRYLLLAMEKQLQTI